MESSPSTPVQLSVSVVLHHSPLPLLDSLLQSLQLAACAAQDSGQLQRVDLYLVNNTCDSEYSEQLGQWLEGWTQLDAMVIHHRELTQNRGFGQAHNSIISTLASDLHIVLNPDAELVAQTLQAGLAAMLREPGTVLLSPQVWGPTDEREFLCKRYPTVLVLLLRGFAPQFIRGLFRPQLDDYEMRDVCSGAEPTPVDIASGCFMLVRTADLQALKGFDEDYFLYFEDFDLSLRLRARGHLVYYPAMQIVHRGGYSANKGLRHWMYFVASGVRFFNRNGWRWM